MDVNELKKAACAAIDAYHDTLIAFGEDILMHPELGYKEHRTSEKMQQALGTLGINDVAKCGMTGLKAWVKKTSGPSVAVIGELDAVISPQHPMADPQTGAAHACGHNAQLAALLGAACGLLAVQNALSGGICLIAAPAEEYIEIGWRSQLVSEGKLSYLGGKQQLISEGVFDDVDMAMMVHSETNAPCSRVVVDGPAGGFIGKNVRFIGKEAHAGGAPWDGVNALNAAALAMIGIHANREVFRDEDHVRVHPILTKGGDLVNTVPADVRMESYVRAASIEAMQSANEKVNRAIRGAAYMIGAEVEIQDMAGYLPLRQNRMLSALFEQNAKQIAPDLSVEHGLTFCGSTDVGDLSTFMPVIQPTITGFSGAAHSRDFCITDPEQAYITPAKLMAATVIDLLADGATYAQTLAKTFPKTDKAAYFALWNQIRSGKPL